MLFYKVTWQIEKGRIDNTKIVDTQIKWEPSAKDAGSTRKKARQMDGYIPNSIQTSKIAVPADKKGFLKFLNSDMLN